MALTDRAGFINRVKRRAYIKLSVTTFDTDITALVEEAVRGLPPQVLLPNDPVETTVNSDKESVTYPAGTFYVARLDLRENSSDAWKPYSLIRNWAGKVYLGDEFPSGHLVRVWPLVPPVVKDVDSVATTTLPNHYDDIVVLRALSAFYDMLAGNKRKYNLYLGSAGSQGDRDMKDSSDFYADKAQTIIDDRVPLEHRGS